MLFLPHWVKLTANKDIIGYLSMPKTPIHNLKSAFSLGFSFSVSGVIYIGHWI